VLLTIFLLQAKPLAPEEDDEVSLKPHSKLKSAAGAKTVSSRPVLKLLIHGSETAAEEGDLTSQGKEAIMEAGEDQAIEIDESLLPLKLRSKKKAVPEKFIAGRVGLVTDLGRASLDQDLPNIQPACCPHTTPALGPSNAKVGSSCLYIYHIVMSNL
jgi:hypothetical protein